MVNLSIDPPPSLRSSHSKSGHSVVASLLVVAALVLLAGGGGFYLGRRTASRPIWPGSTPGEGSLAAAERAEKAAPGSQARPQQGAPAGAAAPLANDAPVAQPEQPAAGGVRRLAVTLRGPLEESVAAALPPADRSMAGELTQLVNRLLVWNIQVARDGRTGDRLDLVYELAVPGQSDMGVIHAVRYLSQKMGRTFAAYRFRPPNAAFARYYQPDGKELEERLVDALVREYEQVTSLLRDGRHHKGVDFKTPVGTPVFAPFDGVVARRNWHFSANGNCLEMVDAASGRHAIFLHLESVAKEMQSGRKIAKGEQIALSGNSGHSTAPHLHYQLESADGRILDPFAIQATHRVAVAPSEMGAFEAEKKKLDDLLGAQVMPVSQPVPPKARAPHRRTSF